MRLWLCRDTIQGGGHYALSFHDAAWVVNEKWASSRGPVYVLCSDHFEQATGFRLHPGEGPVEIEISITRKE